MNENQTELISFGNWLLFNGEPWYDHEDGCMWWKYGKDTCDTETMYVMFKLKTRKQCSS